MSERWKPESGELYYFISTAGDIIPERFYNYEAGSRSRFLHGNVFKTEAEAEVAAEKVKALLLSLHSEPVADCNQLPDWCKVGEWVYLSNAKYYKIEKVDSYGIILAGGIVIKTDDIHAEAVSARLRPYNADEMKELVGKVVCTNEDKTFLVLVHSGNTVLFGECWHAPEDLTLDIYKFPDGSPCGCLEHLENGEWVK